VLNFSFLSSHNLARFIVACLFIVTLIRDIKTNNKIALLFIAPILLLIARSISIIQTISVQEFIIQYKDFITGLLIYYTVVYGRYGHQKLHKTLIISSLLNILLYLGFYFGMVTLQSPLWYDKYVYNILLHQQRGKYFLDLFDPALIPLFFVLIFRAKKHWLKALYILLIGIVIFLGTVSNFRVHLVISALAFLCCLTFTKINRGFLVNVFVFIVLIFGVIQAGRWISYKNTSVDVVSRFSLEDQYDYQTLLSRFNFWSQAFNMFLLKPLTGVGLGNYYEFVSPKLNTSMFTIGHIDPVFAVTAVHPHNVFFAELSQTGFFGITALIFLLGVFAYNDYKVLRKNGDEYVKAYIFCFWLLFTYSLVQPDTIIQNVALYWFLRALIAKTHMKYENK